MAFAQENILSGQGPQIPTIVVPQNGGPVKTISIVDPALPDTPLDCVAQLELQDGETYADWDATGGSVLVGIREFWTDASPVFSATATEVDATEGSFSFRVPAAGTTNPGMYLFEASLYNASDVLVMANAGYMEITPSIAYQQGIQPLSVSQIRRALRDAHPRNNRILEECEFSLAEILDTIDIVVQEYNSTGQPITTYSASNFPHPVQLMWGVIANLLDMAAIWYARNDLKVAADGLDADDMGKAKIYVALALQYRKRWTNWAVMHKRNINIRNGWGTVQSHSFR